jgi:two-component system phosphate regulon sensor histidine kinase PhoR
MRLRLQWRLIIFIFLLSLLLLIIQGYSFHFLKKTLLFSSLIALVMIIPVAYFLVKSFTQPISDLTQKAIQLVSNHSDQKVKVDSHEELRMLSKAIDEIGIQLRNKIEEISKERDYFQTILKGMVEGILVVDERGRILVANNALRQFISLPSNISNRTPLEIIRNSELEEAIRKVIQKGDSASFELNLPPPLGKTLEVNVVGILPSPEEMEGGDERTRGAIAVFHDITRLKELERVHQDFVANVSHELRTPLTTIKGYAETLLEGALKEEVAFQFIQVIKRQSDRLAKIVEDLLTLSKIESKEFQLKIENLLLREVIEDVLNFIQETAEKKKISISLELPDTLMVKADRNYLEQILTNLIDNAIKYGQEGGRLIISATQIKQIEIEIAVRDDGLGIPKEDLPRIFERFYRVDKGRSRELGGTGLGLSIVKHLVQAHGGRVWAESQLGEGSTFFFTLPFS